MSQVCQLDSDCGFFNTCIKNACVHAAVFPVDSYAAFIYSLIPPLTGLAILGGIGGGVLKGPLLLLCLNYSLSTGTYIAYCLQFGGCIVNSLLLFFEKHPEREDRPLVNFPVVLIYNCSISIGTNFGNFLAGYLPQIGNLAIQDAFLIVCLPYLYNKTVQAYHKDKAAKIKMQQIKSNEQQIISQGDSPDNRLQNDQNPSGPNLGRQVSEPQDIVRDQQDEEAALEPQNNLQPSGDQPAPEDQPALENQPVPEVQVQATALNQIVVVPKENDKSPQYLYFEKYAQSRFPVYEMIMIFMFFGINQLLSNMRATSKQKSIIHLEACGYGSTLIVLLLVFVNILMTLGVYYYGKSIEAKMDACGFDVTERYYKPFSFILQYVSGFFTGTISALLGYGSGLVMVPCMLFLNLIPRVSSATSAFNHLILGLNNLLNVVTGNSLSSQQILWYTFLGFLGGTAVTKFGYVMLNKFKVSWFVVSIVVILDLANIISAVIYGVIQSERFGFATLTAMPKAC